MITENTQTPLELRVAASREQLPLVRKMTETVGLYAHLNLDEVADLVLAVDEACSQLLARPGSATELVCRFRLHPDEVGADIAVNANVGPAGGFGFGWHILESLTDRVTMGSDQDGTRITFTRRVGQDA